MFKKNSIVRAMMLSATAAASFVSVNVNAAEKEAAEVERIEVTGSRINRTDMETASPVTVISAEVIAKSGYTSVQEILAVQPTAAGMSLGASSNNGSGGSATVNLRGMGVQRTLVLLNGRRMVSSGTGADSSVDLNTIPVAMIKSIEILKDGASAVYGSDAIAGVVNIITKKDYQGTEVKAELSSTDKGDGESGGFSILHGREVAGGNLVVGLQYSERGDVIQSDRDFVEPGQSSFVPEGSLAGYTPDGNDGFEARSTTYDYTTSSYAQTPNELFSLFSSYNKEVVEDLELSVEAMYTRRDSNQQMAPQPASVNLTTDKLDPSYVQSIQDHYDVINSDPDNLKDPDFEPKEIGETINYKRRMVDAGPRIYNQETDTYRLSVALDGYLDSGDSWSVSATYGRNDSKDNVENSIHAGNMVTSIETLENQQDWFSGKPMDRDFLVSEDIIYTEENEGGNEQLTLAAGYAGMTDYDLGYAFGIEHRKEEGHYTPDKYIQSGQSTAAQQAPTKGDYTVNSVYVEVSLPVTDKLSVESAVRYDDYDTFGGATTWKLGATYTLTDSFMIRSVAATGFRAPSVSELYGGDTGSYDYLTNPWGEGEDSQILVNYTSDENLDAEESESFTLGAVWEVKEGLSTTVDYWQFDITDAIGRANVQAKMDACKAGDTISCDTINITPGDLSEMTSQLTNLGEQNSSGIDWNISYSFDNIRIMLDTTYLLEFKEDGIDYTGKIDGNYGAYSKLKSTLTVNADITDDLSVQYTGQFIEGMVGAYDIDYDGSKDMFTTDNVFYHNVSANYYLNNNWSVNGGIKNLMDTEPEEVPGGNDMGTVPGTYDVVGRTFFLSTSYKF